MKALMSAWMLALMLAAPGAWGDEIEHLANVPPGHVRLDFEPRGSIAPLRFVGTMNPPHVLLNGRPLQLATAPRNGRSPGVYVNGKAVTTNESVGRFFSELRGREAAVARVEIVIVPQSGRARVAEAFLNRVFLEALPKQSRFFTEEEFAERVEGQKVQFQFRGRIPADSELSIEGGTVEGGDNGTVVVSLSLPLGESVITGKLTRKSGLARALTIPVQVVRRGFDKEAVSFSAEVPNGGEAGDPWPIPEHGDALVVHTAPGAKITWSGGEATADEDGEAHLDIDPKQRPEWTEEFTVTLQNGKSEKLEKQLLCSNCNDYSVPFWPRFPIRETYYAGMGGAAYARVDAPGGNSNNVDTDGITYRPSFILGYQLTPRTFLEGKLVWLGSLKSKEGGASNDETKGAMFLSGIIGYHLARNFRPGIGINIFRFSSHVDRSYGQFSSQLFESKQGSYFSIGLILSLGVHFEIVRYLEFGPTFMVAPDLLQIKISGDGSKRTFEHMELLSIRYRFH